MKCIAYLAVLVLPVLSAYGDQGIDFDWTPSGVQLDVDQRPVNEVLDVISNITGIPIATDASDTRLLDGMYKKRRLEDLLTAISPGVAISYIYDERVGDYLIEQVVCAGAVSAADKRDHLRDLEVQNRNLDEKLSVELRQPVQYTGIGAAIAPDEESRGVWLRPVSTNSPAAIAGLQMGDRITAIDGKAVASFANIGEVSAAIRGPAGSMVQLDILHPDGTRSSRSVIRNVVAMEATGAN